MEYIFGETRFSQADDSSLEANQFVLDFNNAIKVVAKMNRVGISLPFDIWGNKRALKEAVAKLQPYVNDRMESAFKQKEEDMRDGQQQPNSQESSEFINQLVYETEDRKFTRPALQRFLSSTRFFFCWCKLYLLSTSAKP